MPTNLYGINDNFHPENSHVIPALIQKIHQAKENNNSEVALWGSGKAMREFLHVDDMAEASLFILELDSDIYKFNTKDMLSHVNVGTGKDITIQLLAETIREVVGYKGNIVFDVTKPDGAMRKLIDINRLKRMGWKSKIELKYGLKNTYDWYRSEKC